MSLGREIHNELRTTCQVGVLYYQHISYFQFFFPTDIMIYTEILRESLLKLQSYPLTHYADYINRVDQGFRLAKTEHSHPLGMVVSTHFRCGKGVKRGLKNGALPFTSYEGV